MYTYKGEQYVDVYQRVECSTHYTYTCTHIKVNTMLMYTSVVNVPLTIHVQQRLKLVYGQLEHTL